MPTYRTSAGPRNSERASRSKAEEEQKPLLTKNQELVRSLMDKRPEPPFPKAIDVPATTVGDYDDHAQKAPQPKLRFCCQGEYGYTSILLKREGESSSNKVLSGLKPARLAESICGQLEEAYHKGLKEGRSALFEELRAYAKRAEQAEKESERERGL